MNATASQILSAVGAVVIVLGGLLPWREEFVLLHRVTYNGTSSVWGNVALVSGAVAVVASLIRSLVGLVAGLAGIAAASAAGYFVLYTVESEESVLTGVYVVFLGSFFALVGSVSFIASGLRRDYESK